MTLLEAFQEYKYITYELERKVLSLVDCFATLRQHDFKECVFQEKVSEKEKLAVLKQIDVLKVDIHSLFIKLLNHTNVLIRILETETFVDLNLVNKLNHEHIEAMQNYNTAIYSVHTIKKDCENLNIDFNKLIDFSKMERQKLKLDIKINEFNEKFFNKLNGKLMSTRECGKEAYQLMMDFMKNGLGY